MGWFEQVMFVLAVLFILLCIVAIWLWTTSA
jgi:hypothetical protein